MFPIGRGPLLFTPLVFTLPFYNNSPSFIHRSIALTRVLRTALVSGGVEKSLLIRLRKETGFPISKCKEAIQDAGGEYENALGLLLERARNHGWEKARRLAGRTALHGCLSVAVQDLTATILEVKCETDFVSRNEAFKSFVRAATLEYSNESATVLSHSTLAEAEDESLWTMSSAESPESFCASLIDLRSSAISLLGENILYSRGRTISLRHHRDHRLAFAVHPSSHQDDANFKIGKYVCLLGYRSFAAESDVPVSIQAATAQKISTHILATNPESLDRSELESQESKETDEKDLKTADSTVYSEEGDEDMVIVEANTLIPEDSESALLRQKFMYDPSQTVSDVCRDAQIVLIDFKKFVFGDSS